MDLFEKYKFDLIFDLENLYENLNEKYKELKFINYEDFRNYIQNNINEMRVDVLQSYSGVNIDSKEEFIITCESGRCYIFNTNNLMDYNIMLDNYILESAQYTSLYAVALPEGKARYCIDRIISAINDKNYEFIYNKLNVIQKNNYYSTYEEFKFFITDSFYNKNDFEIQEDGKNISSSTYQFLVKVSDKEKKENSKLFTFSIFLKDDAEFDFGISK